MKQFRIQFRRYEDYEHFISPSLAQADKLLRANDPAKFHDLVNRDLPRTWFYIPPCVNESEALERYHSLWHKASQYTQGDLYAGLYEVCQSFTLQYLANTDEENGVPPINYAVLAELRNDGVSLRDCEISDGFKNTLSTFHCVYLNDQGQAEGFTITYNKKNPMRYVIAHVVNAANTEARQVRLYYSTDCARIVSGEVVSDEVTNDQCFPAVIGNATLRKEVASMFATDNGSIIVKQAERVKALFKTYESKDFWRYKDSQADNGLEPITSALKNLCKTKRGDGRPSIVAKLLDTLLLPSARSIAKEHTTESLLMSGMLDANKIAECRQMLANICLKQNTGSKTLRQVYWEWFRDVPMQPAQDNLPVAKGSMWLGFSNPFYPSTFFGKTPYWNLFRNSEDSFEGCLANLAEALCQHTLQASHKVNC